MRTAKFEKATFHGADMTKVILRRANLKAYSFVGATLAHADFSEVQAEGANFSRADLSLANLRLANLKRADLSDCKAFDADLSGSLLISANFSGATLQEADLRFARAIGANFTGADLSGADLANADFTEAVFKKTKFWGATARRAKAPAGKSLLFSLSTTFSKAKEKKTKAADEKETKRQKRIADLEADAAKRSPHQTGRRR